MERAVYDHMAELDQRHWWYLGRRKVLAEIIRRLARPPADARILEVGCGTGHNFGMLTTFGAVDAVELDETARSMAEKRLGRRVLPDPLPELGGVADRAYDLICAFDVIEHIPDDAHAIATIAAKLKPGGKLAMTVPAHRWMWSAHDVINHHKRRYSKRSLKALIDGSPLELDSIGYLNSILPARSRAAHGLEGAEKAGQQARDPARAGQRRPDAHLRRRAARHRPAAPPAGAFALRRRVSETGLRNSQLFGGLVSSRHEARGGKNEPARLFE